MKVFAGFGADGGAELAAQRGGVGSWSAQRDAVLAPPALRAIGRQHFAQERQAVPLSIVASAPMGVRQEPSSASRKPRSAATAISHSAMEIFASRSRASRHRRRGR